MVLAKPWWVNLLVVVPLLSLYFWRHSELELQWKRLIIAGAFATAFGFVEAATVVYLRGNVPILKSKLTEPVSLSDVTYVAAIPGTLLRTEIAREAATMIMLVALSWLAATRSRERWALFLWCFAIWDLIYYVGLWRTIHWPTSLMDFDVLFLIPRPWYAQVWYPVAVSALTLAAVIAGRSRAASDRCAV